MRVSLPVIQVSTGLPLPWILLTQYFPKICFLNVFIVCKVVCTSALLQLNCYIHFLVFVKFDKVNKNALQF